MRETIARYRGLLAARLAVLAEELRVAEALYKEGHGDFSMVTLENVALFERQIRAIERLRERFLAMDIEAFDTVEQFKDHVLARIEELRASHAILRPSLRMVMECVRDL